MASAQLGVAILLFLSQTISALPSSPCACNGFVSSEGGGECKTRIGGKLWCYVKPQASCSDVKESSSQTGQSWSYEACQTNEIQTKTGSGLSSSCTCNGFVSSEGGGECKTRLNGEKWCYVKPEATCSDNVESKSQVGQSWSYEACRRNSKSIENPTSPCTCNGHISSEGGGECKTRLDGKAWCYVGSQTTCSDKRKSSNQVGQHWSHQACQHQNTNANEAGSLNIAEGLGDEAPVRTRSNVRRLGSKCKTPKGESGTCSFIHDPQCRSVANSIITQGWTFQIIIYITQAIKAPCGWQNSDISLCCKNDEATPTKPTTAKPTPPSTQGPPTQCGRKPGARIVGGTEATKGEWPWAAVLGRKLRSGRFEVHCGGTLLNHDTILTAAHCLQDKPGIQPITHVRLGDHDITTTNDGAENVDFTIAQKIMHPDWNPTTLDNDIAMIKLDGTVTYATGIAPICPPDDYKDRTISKLLKGNQPTVVGWGETKEGSGSQDILRHARVPMVTQKRCKQNYRGVQDVTISDIHLCAGNTKRDTCSGDSGGALMSDHLGDWAVIGITSFGVGCAKKGYPGVYTRVDKYLDWIKGIMQEEESAPIKG